MQPTDVKFDSFEAWFANLRKVKHDTIAFQFSLIGNLNDNIRGNDTNLSELTNIPGRRECGFLPTTHAPERVFKGTYKANQNIERYDSATSTVGIIPLSDCRRVSLIRCGRSPEVLGAVPICSALVRRKTPSNAWLA